MFKRLRQISQRVTNDLAAELLKRSPFKRPKLSKSSRVPEVRASLRQKPGSEPESRDHLVRKVRSGQTKRTSDENEKRIASIRVSTGQGVKTLSAKKGSAKSSSAKKPSKATPVKAATAKSAAPKSGAAKPAAKKAAPTKSASSPKSAPSAKGGAKVGAKAQAVLPSKEKSAPKLAPKASAQALGQAVASAGKAQTAKSVNARAAEAQAAVKSPAVVSAPVRGKSPAAGVEKVAAARSEIASAQVEPMPASVEVEVAPVKLRQDPDPDRVAEKKKKKDDFKIDRNGDLVAQWEALREKTKLIKPLNYKMSESFEARIPIMHKVLGWGFVISNQNDRLEVLFKDGIRNLISNYKG